MAAITAWMMRVASLEAPVLDLGFEADAWVPFVVALGVGVCASGAVSFRRVGTTVNPLRPEAASALVVSGVYKFSRNPMYLGFLIVLVSWGMFLSNLLACCLLPLFVLYLSVFQIRPEEEALRLRFGLEYERYQARVRRWL